MRRMGLRTGQLDVLLASPPCQTYSRNNRARKPGDDRNWLYKSVLAWIRMARPRAVLMENVAAMRESDGGIHESAITSELGQLNYAWEAWTLDAACFGVPQNRVRRFFLAYRGDLDLVPIPPRETHFPPSSGHSPQWVSVGQAIDDLPSLEMAGVGDDPFISQGDPLNPDFTSQYGEYAALMRATAGAPVAHHSTPALSQLALKRLSRLGPGEAIAHLPDELKPAQGFRSAYGRLHPGRPAWTITANCDYPSRGRFSHYSLDRGISMREAARLQSFPDEFAFVGPREHVARQIGNAVPPLVGLAFANAIGDSLQSLEFEGSKNKSQSISEVLAP
jgi:DNA (cytosine-5)-methyltransferase 1